MTHTLRPHVLDTVVATTLPSMPSSRLSLASQQYREASILGAAEWLSTTHSPAHPSLHAPFSSVSDTGRVLIQADGSLITPIRHAQPLRAKR
jgi:hypothetical protein